MGRTMVNGQFEGNSDCRRALSPREREVAQLVSRGHSNKEIARKLQLSEGTVKLHLHSVFQKLGAKNWYSLILANFPSPLAGRGTHNTDLKSPDRNI